MITDRKPTQDAEKAQNDDHSDEKASHRSSEAAHPELPKDAPLQEVDAHPIDGPWVLPKNLYIIARYKALPFLKKILLHGSSG